MKSSGIHNGDLLIVDRSLDPVPGHIVVAALDDGFTVKRLARHHEVLRLEADNPDYPPLEFRNYNNVQIWGVAIYSIHSLTLPLKKHYLHK